jgi:energy-coupling factor transporter ATP-binding protein EcfA2
LRLADLFVENSLPIKLFAVQQLSDVVVLAGPNGVGKTRLLARVVAHLRGGTAAAEVAGTIEATAPSEVEAWGGRKTLDLASAADMELFRSLLQRNRRRHKWQSSLVNFESDRTVTNLQPFTFTWDLPDPYEEEVDWGATSGLMRDRFQDTVHTMYRLIEAQKQSIANRAIALRRDGKSSMRLVFDDPMAPFRRVFSQLLAPKELVDPSARTQRLQYLHEGETLDFSTLSSGEREVVNIAFDFLLRSPEDCLIFFDEPELHLHPELSYRMIETLQTIGTRNQFFFSTHSLDIITASLDRSVVFVSPPREKGGVALNQAIPVTEDDDTNQALRLLGQSIGIVALGRKLVLVEGTSASLDKQTYGAITRGAFPSLVLVPSQGRQVVESFETVYQHVLSRSIWGVEFFMLCDGDTAPIPGSAVATAAIGSGRLRVLPKYHLENYFLDEALWATAFAPMEKPGSWLLDPTQIRAEIRRLAGDLVSYATALAMSSKFRIAAGNIDLMPKDCHGKSVDELIQLLQEAGSAETGRIATALDPVEIERETRDFYAALSESIRTDTDVWKISIPAKALVAQFARRAGLDPSRAKTLYINTVIATGAPTFDDISEILSGFASA